MVHSSDRFERLRSFIKTGIRGFLQNRAKSVGAAATLAVGIGMSVAMFSLIDAVVLRPLPFPGQESIVVISKVDPAAGRYIEEMAYPELGDMEQNIPEFQFVAMMPTSLYGYARVLQTPGGPVQIEGTPVSHNFFRVLGVRPLLGRDFRPEDEHVGAARVVMVSYSVWRNYFHSDPALPGRVIELNGEGYTVAGVLRPQVEFPRGAGFWYPLGVEKNVVERRTATFLQAIARVKPGVRREAAVTKVNALVRRLAAEHPEAYSPTQQAHVVPLTHYWTGASRVQLWILLGAALLLFCASVFSASLLVVSSVLGRANEFATRVALGASRGQILWQLLAEGAVLVSVACGAGLSLAFMLLQFLTHWAPPDIPRLAEASLHPASIVFAVIVSAIAGLACSILPGLPAVRMRVEAALREGGSRLSLSRRSLQTRNLFVLAQSAVTVMVLLLSGLFLMSYRALLRADVGFTHRDTLSVNLQVRGTGLFAGAGVDPNRRLAFYQQLLDRLREAPGITSAAAVLVRPLEGTIGWERGYEFELNRQHRKEETLPKANFEAISPQYFQTVGAPLLAGRDFNEHDSEKAAPVAIISRNLARQMETSGRPAVGQRIRLAGSPQWVTVVGVCGNARYRNIAEEDTSIFVPYRQSGTPTPYVLVRGSQSRQELSTLVRHILAGIDTTQAVTKEATIGELIDQNMARHRFNMTVLSWFGGVVLSLAAMGVYGVVAESTAARQKEIAIRLALGAPRRSVMNGLVAKTLGFAVAGEVLGLVAALPAADRISALLYGVSPWSLPLLAGALGFASITCLIASWAPAWAAVDRDSIAL